MGFHHIKKIMGKLFINNLALVIYIYIYIYITLQYGLIQYFTTYSQPYNTVVEEVLIAQQQDLTKYNIGNRPVQFRSLKISS